MWTATEPATFVYHIYRHGVLVGTKHSLLQAQREIRDVLSQDGVDSEFSSPRYDIVESYDPMGEKYILQFMGPLVSIGDEAPRRNAAYRSQKRANEFHPLGPQVATDD